MYRSRYSRSIMPPLCKEMQDPFNAAAVEACGWLEDLLCEGERTAHYTAIWDSRHFTTRPPSLSTGITGQSLIGRFHEIVEVTVIMASVPLWCNQQDYIWWQDNRHLLLLHFFCPLNAEIYINLRKKKCARNSMSRLLFFTHEIANRISVYSWVLASQITYPSSFLLGVGRAMYRSAV